MSIRLLLIAALAPALLATACGPTPASLCKETVAQCVECNSEEECGTQAECEANYSDSCTAEDLDAMQALLDCTSTYECNDMSSLDCLAELEDLSEACWSP